MDFLNDEIAYLIDTQPDALTDSLRKAMREIFVDKEEKEENIKKGKEKLQAAMSNLPYLILDRLSTMTLE